MNELAATGVDPAAVNAEELGEADRGARARSRAQAFTEALAAQRGRRTSRPSATWARARSPDASELDPVIDQILAANAAQVEAYRGGKEGLLGFFVGQVMKETGGGRTRKVVNDLLREKLKA